MKNKLIFADYDPQTGNSTVAIRNKYGVFQGYATCHPDEEYPSSFAGCRYAEIRARMQVVRYENALLKAQIEELERFYKILKGMKGFNPSSMECKRLRKRMYELNAERKKNKELLKSMKAGLSDAIDKHDVLVKKLTKNIEEN